VHFVIGEEDGGLGAFATLQRGHRGRCCIIPEPTNLHVITANAARSRSGSRCRASPPTAAPDTPEHRPSTRTCRSTGRWPSSKPAGTRSSNRAMTDFPIPYPLSVGRISAGEWSSTVPDLAIVEGRLGLRIEEDPATAQREFEEQC
jgi:acetylornithine deacetylase